MKLENKKFEQFLEKGYPNSLQVFKTFIYRFHDVDKESTEYAYLSIYKQFFEMQFRLQIGTYLQFLCSMGLNIKVDLSDIGNDQKEFINTIQTIIMNGFSELEIQLLTTNKHKSNTNN